jgi:hypothetical protein
MTEPHAPLSVDQSLVTLRTGGGLDFPPYDVLTGIGVIHEIAGNFDHPHLPAGHLASSARPGRLTGMNRDTCLTLSRRI